MKLKLFRDEVAQTKTYDGVTGLKFESLRNSQNSRNVWLGCNSVTKAFGGASGEWLVASGKSKTIELGNQ